MMEEAKQDQKEHRKGNRNRTGSSATLRDWPHPLLDALRKEMGWSSDGVMAEELKVLRSGLSKFRHGTNQISAEFVLKVHKRTGWPVERIEFLACPQVQS
jgi:hypothetical protein